MAVRSWNAYGTEYTATGGKVFRGFFVDRCGHVCWAGDAEHFTNRRSAGEYLVEDISSPSRAPPEEGSSFRMSCSLSAVWRSVGYKNAGAEAVECGVYGADVAGPFQAQRRLFFTIGG